MTLPEWIRKRLVQWAMNFAARKAPDMEIGTDYLKRWFVIPPNPLLSVYIHVISSSDPGRGMHDHRSANLSIVLSGKYDEVTPEKWARVADLCPLWWDGHEFSEHRTKYGGDITFRWGSTPHRLLLEPGQKALTLFITGPTYRKWGFWTKTGWVPWDEYDA